MDVLVPAWPAPARVHALQTMRSGGVSASPYDLLNLGDHVGDDPAAVAINRQRLRDRTGAVPVFLEQVHGTAVVQLPGPSATLQADACYSLQPGVACTIMVADCLPVLFCDRAGRAVAAAHAGWRGLAAGVLEATIAALRAVLPAPVELMAWLGPSIGPAAFEVGPEVRNAFDHVHPQAGQYFRPHTEGKWLADLPALARLQLAQAGVVSIYGNDSSAAWCTVTQASRFFSHRRDRISGRMAACIWLD